MPEMSGIELMKVLHEDDRFDNLPILVATGDHNAQVEKECLSNGAWDFVVKPYEPSIIKLRLSNIIGKSQSSLMEQVKELAQKDTLTGIYNRAYFMNQTAQMIRIHRDIQFILVRVDIDYFRNYNASFGTDAGNELICSMAQRIKKNVMDSGLEYATYGRIESDVFCICVPYHRELLMKAIQDTDEQLHSLKNNYSLKASFGLYIIENPDEDMERMYGRTLEAVRECKHNVNQLYTFYNQAMEENERIAQFLSGEMERAIKERQFVVYLQPKYSMESNSPCGAEALVRWNHPYKGMISPGQFIPVFEKNGMIIQLDYYMWDSVCSLLGEWIKEGRTVYPVSVNISRISLNNPAIVDQILNLTKKYQVPRELLQLEITESAYMSNPELMKSIISGFRKHGFMILMDDLPTLKGINLTRYNQYDIHMMIQFMGKIFDVVRLVDPKKTSVVTLLPEGGVKEEDYCCFKVWGKEKRCENCTSMCSMEGHCMINKFELMKENIFYVISQPVKVKVGHNTERELVLEIVSKITDEKTIPQGEVREV